MALFIGQTYFDLTADLGGKPMPTGNHKEVFNDYESGFGGNALIAALACNKLGVTPHLLTTVGEDRLGTLFTVVCKDELKIPLYARKVPKTALSIVVPHNGDRAIGRCRHDEPYLNEVPPVDIRNMRALHVDGHQHDAVMHYAKECRELGILTSIDLGRLRGEGGRNTFEQLPLMDVVISAEEIPDDIGISVSEMFAQLHARGCKLAAVTLGAKGVVWQAKGGEISQMPAFMVPKEHVIDTSGAGDVFHGAFICSYLQSPEKDWAMHLTFASAAASLAIQRLGTEAGIPTRAAVDQLFQPRLVGAA